MIPVSSQAHPYRTRRQDGQMIVSYCQQPDCPGRRGCKPCKNAHARLTRPAYGELPADQRQRANCRSYTKVLQRRGVLPKGPCEGCGAATATNVHSPEYNPRHVGRACTACRPAVLARLVAELRKAAA